MGGIPLSGWRHIVIEGPIGAGKTSLAKRLASTFDAELLLEQAQDNPYLERFYADRRGYAFQAQLFFLFQRARQMQTLAQQGMFERPVVADFLFAKDALFAGLNLGNEEYRLYAQMYAQLAPQVPQPDLVIWLQASPSTLMQRIRQRGIAMEQALDEDDLQRLCDAYAEYFDGWDGAPVLAVHAERFDPAANDTDFELLLRRLAAFRGPREVLDAQRDAPLV